MEKGNRQLYVKSGSEGERLGWGKLGFEGGYLGNRKREDQLIFYILMEGR